MLEGLQATSSQLWVHSARTPIPTQSPGPRKGADEREGEMGGCEAFLRCFESVLNPEREGRNLKGNREIKVTNIYCITFSAFFF